MTAKIRRTALSLAAAIGLVALAADSASAGLVLANHAHARLTGA